MRKIFCFFLFSFVSIHSQSRQTKPACFDAPLWVYNEEKRAYYRQDWCKTSKAPIYFENIPFIERDKKNEKFLSQR